MTSTFSQSPGADAPGGSFCAPDPSPVLSTLKARKDFLAAARAKRAHKPGFVLQARHRAATEPSATPLRIGYTCSKKVGNAVARNRAKRRLRAAALSVLPNAGQPGWDYVLIGRASHTANIPFAQMCFDLQAALATIHQT